MIWILKLFLVNSDCECYYVNDEANRKKKNVGVVREQAELPSTSRLKVSWTNAEIQECCQAKCATKWTTSVKGEYCQRPERGKVFSVSFFFSFILWGFDLVCIYLTFGWML